MYVWRSVRCNSDPGEKQLVQTTRKQRSITDAPSGKCWATTGACLKRPKHDRPCHTFRKVALEKEDSRLLHPALSRATRSVPSQDKGQYHKRKSRERANYNLTSRTMADVVSLKSTKTHDSPTRSKSNSEEETEGRTNTAHAVGGNKKPNNIQ